METLFYELSILANKALEDNHLDPSKIEDLMALFEQEAYISSCTSSSYSNTTDMTRPENLLNSLMDDAMDEYRCCCAEAERYCQEELSRALKAADAAKKLGHSFGAAAASSASSVSKKYIDAARASAVAIMKSGFASVSKFVPCFHPVWRNLISSTTIHMLSGEPVRRALPSSLSQ
ncbi:hypothetical protein J5N97_009318 [Dioscorea zingiberensis]|uniref:Uncharacterized protein n=1 Tax=Dioscorea zingiberensis TaxID=325984 RepID=A0A9D5HLP9_9LILI|nr:hypothetical protein J5N97_009318 [Dioscorea zingiberensis]